MEEARLNHLLRGLPRESAPGGFTAQVLRRLDEKPRPAGNRPRPLPPKVRWHRLMVATATVGALGVSVGISVGVLQPERSQLSESTAATATTPSPAAATATAAIPAGLAAGAPAGPAAGMGLPGTPGPAGSAIERTFRHESGPGELPRPGLDARQAASRQGAGTAAAPATLGLAQAHEILRELQLERGRLERELHSLRRPGGGSPNVFYLGGLGADDNVDLVLGTGRARPPGSPAGERDDGENFNYL